MVVDHSSRRAVGFAVFRKAPSAAEVAASLDLAIANVGRAPRHIISDKGKQFFCEVFKGWCKSHGIRPRFGAVGKHGSIAVVERFIRSVKEECTRRIVVPMSQGRFREVKGRLGARLRLKVEFLEGRRHLPVVSLRKVA